MKNKVSIIGGGASGVMSAIIAAREGSDVTLFEKNDRILKKLLRTGNGRCNFSNVSIKADDYVTSGRDKRWHKAALDMFTHDDTVKFFENIGVLCSVEEGRCYPRSGQAAAVVDMLRFELVKQNVNIVTNCRIDAVKKSSTGFKIMTETGEKHSGSVIVATGSPASLPGGEYTNFGFLNEFRHTVVPYFPVLVQLTAENEFLKALSGQKAHARLTAYDSRNHMLSEKTGELLFTDYGISGIVTMSLSVAAAGLKRYKVSVNFVPEYSPSELYAMLAARRSSLGHLCAEDFLTGIISKRIASAVIKKSGSEKLTTPVSELSDTQIKAIAAHLCSFELNITGTNGIKNAQVCTGGISTDEVDKNTMESKLCPGLYFAGEALDIAGDCGGYNLQWAWSSGFAAGKSAGGKHENNNKSQ